MPKQGRPEGVPLVGVAVFIVKRDSKSTQFLIGKRMGSHGAGTWALPGGHLEFEETPYYTAWRETEEETGLAVKVQERVIAVTNDVYPVEKKEESDEKEESGEKEKSKKGPLPKHYVTLFVRSELEDPTQVPKVMEPNKCEKWEWATWDDLKDWAKHQGEDEVGEYANRKLFLPMKNLIAEYPDFSL